MYTCPQLLGQEREDGLCDPVPQRVPATTYARTRTQLILLATSSAHRLSSLHPAFSSAKLVKVRRRTGGGTARRLT